MAAGYDVRSRLPWSLDTLQTSCRKLSSQTLVDKSFRQGFPTREGRGTTPVNRCAQADPTHPVSGHFRGDPGLPIPHSGRQVAAFLRPGHINLQALHQMSVERKKILVVEDNPGMLSQLRKRLYGEGYQPLGASNSEAAIQAMREQQPDLMVLDLGIIDEDAVNPSLDGFGLLGWVRRCMPEVTIPIIIFTVDDSERVDDLARRQGVHAVHRKAGGFNQLLKGIASALAGGSGSAADLDDDDDGDDEAAA